IKYIGLSASTKPHQDRGAMPKKASGTSGASFGPVIERMLRSVTAERPIKGQDFDTGQQIELPVELEKAPEEQFFHWVSYQGIDLIAWQHGDNWDLWTSLTLGSLEESSWLKAGSSSIKAALKSGTVTLQRT